MTKSIYQLIPDVKEFLRSQQELQFSVPVHFGRPQQPPSLRLSKMGEMCPRHLWYSIHHPELAEPMPAEALFKFSFGHTIEAKAIALAKAAGHEVTGEQDELSVDGVKGHRDCVIDGYVVDVKSCSGRMFEKFETKSIRYDDPFGYLAQLDGYMVGSADDDLVQHKDVAFIWAIDKTLGKMCLYEHRIRRDFILERIERYRRIVGAVQAPGCECKSIADGESGNLRLDAKASYSPFKFCCNPHIRTFFYAKPKGLTYLTRVVRVPNVPELTKEQGWTIIDTQ